MNSYGLVKNALIEVLTDIQNNNGQPVGDISDNTCPTTDLAEFDSVHCVEACALLSAKLGCDIDPKVMLPLKSGPPLTVKVMTERIVVDMTRKETKNHGRDRFPKEGNR